MKIIYNKLIPFKGFYALSFCGIMFIRKEYDTDYWRNSLFQERSVRHETIHYEQQKEMLFIFFFIWYILEWLIRGLVWLFTLGKVGHPYKDLLFEKEAYNNERNIEYLNNRKHFNWLKQQKTTH